MWARSTLLLFPYFNAKKKTTLIFITRNFCERIFYHIFQRIRKSCSPLERRQLKHREILPRRKKKRAVLLIKKSTGNLTHPDAGVNREFFLDEAKGTNGQPSAVFSSISSLDALYLFKCIGGGVIPCCWPWKLLERSSSSSLGGPEKVATVKVTSIFLSSSLFHLFLVLLFHPSPSTNVSNQAYTHTHARTHTRTHIHTGRQKIPTGLATRAWPA